MLYPDGGIAKFYGVTGYDLPAFAVFCLTVYPHLAVGDDVLGLATAGDQSLKLENLVELNRFPGDFYIPAVFCLVFDSVHPADRLLESRIIVQCGVLKYVCGVYHGLLTWRCQYPFQALGIACCEPGGKW